ncbi:MAG: deoxyribose-phosphate aldolase [Candidatus Heimdallarchaeota archaeon]
MELSKAELARMIDHTLLKAETTTKDILRICQEAKQFGFASVVVNPTYVKEVAVILKKSGVKVCTVVGFPLGASTTEVKVFETQNALQNGADELDMVINVGSLKSSEFDHVMRDIKGIVDAAEEKVVKVIIETCYLSEEEKIKACQLAKAAGAHFVKTSTGFGPRGATIEDVQLMRKVVGPNMGIKAAGGIRTYEDAIQMIRAGANRLGASASVTIIEGCPND